MSNYRWRVVALLFFATSINYIDRQIIGILKPFISGELGRNEADYGYIVTAFQVAYAIGLICNHISPELFLPQISRIPHRAGQIEN